jgi:hypothetical protein
LDSTIVAKASIVARLGITLSFNYRLTVDIYRPRVGSQIGAGGEVR